MYNSFLPANSSRPLKYAVLSVLFSIVVFVIFGLFYQVNRTVLGEGEVISIQGEKDIIARVDGTLLEFKQSVGVEFKSGQIIAQLKIPSTDYQSISQLLIQVKKFYDEQTSDPKLTNPWPDLTSDNSTVMTTLTFASQTWNRYLVVVRESIVIAKRRIENLKSRKLKATTKLEMLKKSNQSKLMGALQDELIEQIEQTQEEMISVEEDIRAKKNIARSESLSQIKNSYLAIYDFLEQHIIRAPADGLLAKTNVTSFQQIQKGQILFSIIPSPAAFAVKLRIPSGRIGKIEINSKVQIAVESYPYQKFGSFTGEVFTIDRIITTKDSFFEVKATIRPPENSETRTPANDLTLLTGMKVKGYVITRRQALLRMIYERIYLDESW